MLIATTHAGASTVTVIQLPHMASTAALRSACSFAELSQRSCQTASKPSCLKGQGIAVMPFTGRRLPPQRFAKSHGRVHMGGGMTSSGGILLPPFDDAYMNLAKKYGNAKFPAPQMGAASPAQVERGGGSSGGQHKSRRPPPDLPSLLLNSRIVYIGMPVRKIIVHILFFIMLHFWVTLTHPASSFSDWAS